MIITFGWPTSEVIFKTVAAIEELTNVAPNVNLEHKVASRMLVHIVSYIKDHFVKDDKFTSSFNRIVKICGCKVRCVLFDDKLVIGVNKLAVSKLLNTK